tara:strand:+ start:321 stop:596 length:276 start_codon:yes stop_codon:yes gene_type:complete
MGNNATKNFNKIFSHHGQGGTAAGGSPDDWNQHARDPNQPKPPPPPAPPTIPHYEPPPFYSPRQSQLQKSTYNPSSTSHNYLQRFGAASHY